MPEPETKPEPAKLTTVQDDILRISKEYVASGDEYIDRFIETWDECDRQIRCQKPTKWSKKKDWQTQIVTPLQSNTVESAKAYLKKMLFPKKFFNIVGIQEKNKERDQYIEEIFDRFFSNGGFPLENDYALEEGCGIGTSFMKFPMRPDGMGPEFTNRELRKTRIDPQCGRNFDKSRFWIDTYVKDIGFIIEEARKDESLYDKEELKKIIEAAQSQVTKEMGDDKTMIVRSIDNTEDIKIPATWKNVTVHEIWGKYPKPLSDNGQPPKEYVYEDRAVTIVNLQYVLRNDKNEFGFLPAQALRVKKRLYDFYALGYIERTRGYYDLANTIINLGFDSLKICAFDIIMVDEDAIQDPDLKYGPLEVWRVKSPRQNVVMTRQSVISAIGEIMKGLALVDSLQQDATGVTRHAQGTQTMGGPGSETETLGEYRAKLAMIDQRFLDIGLFIEHDYIVPILKKMFKILINSKLFDQAKVDKLLGKKEVKRTNELGEEVTEFESKLDLAELRTIGEMGFAFKSTGVIQLTGQVELSQKYQNILQMALGSPIIMMMIKLPELVKRLMQILDVPDPEELMKPEEELRAEMERMQQQLLMQQQGGQA